MKQEHQTARMVQCVSGYECEAGVSSLVFRGQGYNTKGGSALMCQIHISTSIRRYDNWFFIIFWQSMYLISPLYRGIKGNSPYRRIQKPSLNELLCKQNQNQCTVRPFPCKDCGLRLLFKSCEANVAYIHKKVNGHPSSQNVSFVWLTVCSGDVSIAHMKWYSVLNHMESSVWL